MASPVAETSETLALVKFGPNGISRGSPYDDDPGTFAGACRADASRGR